MIYRKRGRVVRWENGTLIRVSESGVAIEDGDLFTCHPELVEGPGWEVRAQLEVPALSVPSNIRVERLLMTSGIAEHHYGDRTWIEETKRLHLSLTKQTLRVLIDQADFDTAHIDRVTNALARAETTERDAPARLRLAPNVTAALLPSLVGLAPPNVALLQTAGGIDGKGNDIVEAAGDWPNWYRPSYRVRPLRAPLNLRLECAVTAIDRDRPIAIALLAPVEGTTLRVLVEDGPRVYPSSVRVTRIDAVAAERVWYPYGAGSFGAEMML